MKKVLIGTTVALVLAVTLGIGGWFVSDAFAQGPTGGFAGYGWMHNNTAVLDLLKVSAADLLKDRQAGKSLLDIAQAKGVTEDKLVGALVQPITTMHGWMGQAFGNATYATQMTQWMREWIAKDIRETKFGTMTDFRLGLGWNGSGVGYGMMGGFNGPSTGSGYGFGGMMGGFNGQNNFGGMMGGWRR